MLETYKMGINLIGMCHNQGMDKPRSDKRTQSFWCSDTQAELIRLLLKLKGERLDKVDKFLRFVPKGDA